MDPFSRYAFFTIARDASFVAIADGILMAAYSFDLRLALFIGACVALLFALILLARAFCLTEDRIVASEPWQVLDPEQRPVGDDGRRMARERLMDVMLKFAKNASAAASLMFGTALIASLS
jgi:hypothetical protein